ncbi:hypothetical protein [Patulibacter americanus]|uniref:hypothetical protein n=1 Tax=Patulibacter americanus TaxID=588672 RepID=UPI0003B5D66A|nr:hypothetical protein [Patulibacter americanus]
MDDQLLAIYLNDHLAAATGGLSLAQRARDAHEPLDPDLHRFLVELTGEIAEDRRELLRALQLLGASKDPLKRIVAALAERAGRLKANGRLVKRSPLSSLVELEGLSIAVQGKRTGWLVLHDLEHPKLAPIDFAQLIRRAEDQHRRIEDRRRPLAVRVLRGDDPKAAAAAASAAAQD